MTRQFMHQSGNGLAMVIAMVGLLGLMAPVAAQTALETYFFDQINQAREMERTCPEGTYADGTILEATHYAAAPPLQRDAKLDSAARAYAQAIAAREATIQEEYRFVGPSGYLPWDSKMAVQLFTGTDPDTRSVDSAVHRMANTSSFDCNKLMSPDHVDIGVGIATVNGRMAFLFIIGDPFDPDRIPEYRRQIFEDINAIRTNRVTCPGGETFGPLPPYQWSNMLAQAAQNHSDDMATNGFVGGDPHAGNDGLRPRDRVDLVGCRYTAGVAENVMLNAYPLRGVAQSWVELSPGHCHNVMRNMTHVGIGIAQGSTLASQAEGRQPWVTLKVATPEGDCTQGDIGSEPPPEPPPAQVTRYGIAASDYQAVFDELTAMGLRPSWVDGYNIGNETFFNVVFDHHPSGPPWAAYHNQSREVFQQTIDTLSADGFRLAHVDMYLANNSLQYMSIFVQEAGTPWQVHLEQPSDVFQQTFDSLVPQGYRITNQSGVHVNGTTYVTALFDQEAVGSWAAWIGLDRAQYVAEHQAQLRAGKYLKYMNAYDVDGSPRFSGIWDERRYAGWIFLIDRTADQFQAGLDFTEDFGLLTRSVTGYRNGSMVNFGGLMILPE